MALTIPSSDDLLGFWGDDAITDDEEYLDKALQLSADLLWLACGIENDPTDARLFRLEQFAIMDMAIYTVVHVSQSSENYNSYSMESIGSYRYSKKLTAAALNAESGVELFDKFVQYWLFNGNADGTVDKTSGISDFENVFAKGVNRLTTSEQLIHSAPAQFEFGVFNGLGAVFTEDSDGFDGRPRQQ